MWQERLPAAAVRIQDALIEAYPDELDREELAERTGLTASGGTFGAGVGLFRRYALAQGRDRGCERVRCWWIGSGDRRRDRPGSCNQAVMERPLTPAHRDERIAQVMERLNATLARVSQAEEALVEAKEGLSLARLALEDSTA